MASPTRSIVLAHAGAAQRLEGLQRLADRLRSTAQMLGRQRQEIDAEHSRLAAEIAAHVAHATRSTGALEVVQPSNFSLPPEFGEFLEHRPAAPRPLATPEQIAQLEDDPRLKRLAQQLADLDVDIAACHARLGPASQIAKACSAWLHEHPDAPALTIAPDAALERLNVGELREELRAATDARASIEIAPLPIEEARQRLRRAIEAACADAARSISLAPFVSTSMAPMLAGMPRATPRDAIGEIWAVLAQADPDRCFTAISVRLDAFYKSIPQGAAISTAERAKRLAALDARLLAIGWIEELRIRADDTAIRRGEALPAIVLGEATT